MNITSPFARLFTAVNATVVVFVPVPDVVAVVAVAVALPNVFSPTVILLEVTSRKAEPLLFWMLNRLPVIGVELSFMTIPPLVESKAIVESLVLAP
jgi:hypothetical protein